MNKPSSKTSCGDCYRDNCASLHNCWMHPLCAIYLRQSSKRPMWKLGCENLSLVEPALEVRNTNETRRGSWHAVQCLFTWLPVTQGPYSPNEPKATRHRSRLWHNLHNYPWNCTFSRGPKFYSTMPANYHVLCVNPLRYIVWHCGSCFCTVSTAF